MARLTAAERRERARELRAALVRVTRDGLGRFVDHTKLKTCDTASCGLDDLEDAQDWAAKFREVDATLEALEQMLRDPELRDDALEVFYEVRSAMREDAERLERIEARKDAAMMREAFEADTEGPGPGGGWGAWVEGQDVPDSMDVAGLEADQARRLALALGRMNARGGRRRSGWRAYVWRNGRRYVNPGLRYADLYDPTLRELGLDVALWGLVREGRLQVTYTAPGQAY